MDGSLGARGARINKLLDRLKARTTHDGRPRAGYEQNVAQLRAELAVLETRNTPKQIEGENGN